MWKLKYSCPFYGYEFFLALLAPLAFFAEAFVPADHPLLGLLTALLTYAAGVVLLFLLLHRLKPGEREKIENAEMDLWEPLNDLEIEQIRNEPRPSMLRMALTIGAILLGTIVLAYPLRHITGMMLTVLAMGLCVAAIGVLSYRKQYVWASVDDSAAAMIWKVDDTFSHFNYGRQNYRGRGLYRYRSDEPVQLSYMVFYRPDGKYVLRCPNGEFPDYIRVVRFRSHARWVPWYPEGESPYSQETLLAMKHIFSK